MKNLLTGDWNVDVDWKEVHNLTRESHKKICDHVLPGVANPFEQEVMHKFKYVNIPEHVDIKSVRYVDRALLPLPDCDPMHRIPVVECFYKEKKFFITHGDDNHVFNLERAPNTDLDIFRLSGRIIAIDYDKLGLSVQ